MNMLVDVSNGMQAIELCSGKNRPVLNCGVGQRSLTCLMAVILVYLTFFLELFPFGLGIKKTLGITAVGFLQAQNLPVANGVKAPKVTQSTGINPGKPNTGFIISSCTNRILNEGTSSVHTDSPATV